MKKILIVVIAFLLAYFAYDFYNKNIMNDVVELHEGEMVMIEPQFDMVFDASKKTFNMENIGQACAAESEIVCAVEMMAKCTIKPDLDGCSKDMIPDFVFMEDENLGRPTEISYQIVSMKPIDKNSLEVRTKGDCNDQWFGLCKGDVIYVVDNSKGYFRVKDVYALD